MVLNAPSPTLDPPVNPLPGLDPAQPSAHKIGPVCITFLKMRGPHTPLFDAFWGADCGGRIKNLKFAKNLPTPAT